MLDPTDDARFVAPSTSRLVIRVKLIPREAPPPRAKWRSSKSALLLTSGAVAAALLSWLGISTFKSDPVRTEVAPVVAAAPKPAPETTATGPVEPEVQQPPAAPTSAINEIIPDVPRSALNTIRGTVRVSVRVSVDKQGTVVDAAAEDRGPSRYFERLALEAAKKWTFTPAPSEERRMMLVRFNFTQAGASAHASPAP